MNTTVALFSQFGLTPDDEQKVMQLTKRVDVRNPLSVVEFGREIAQSTSRYADVILEQTRAKDLETVGGKLTQLLETARKLNTNSKSKIPIVGRLLDKFRLSISRIMTEFDNTKKQIDALTKEVSSSQQNMIKRNTTLEEMFHAVKDEYKQLGIHIVAGKTKLAEMKEYVEQLKVDVNGDSFRAQELSDFESTIHNLDKRLGDLMAVQHSALQSLPMIRMIQANNQMLSDKFHTIMEVTIPAWKRQFVLAIGLQEQQRAVGLANAIDETTNAIIRGNAQLLHTNSIETSKASMRLVIDVETLREAQSLLLQTIDEVKVLQKEGVAQRKENESNLLSMRDELKNRFSGNSN